MTYPSRKKLADCQATELAKGVLQLANQLETTTGQNDNKAITPLKLQKRILDSSSVVNGTTFATQNFINGTVNYSTGFDEPLPKQYLLNNDKIKTTSKILWSIQYDTIGDETLIPCSYMVENGICKFYVHLVGGLTTDIGPKITYIILNP